MLERRESGNRIYGCRSGMTSRQFWTSGQNGGLGYIDQTYDRSFEACAASCNTHDDCVAFDWADKDYEHSYSKHCRLVDSITGEFAPRTFGGYREFCRLRYTCQDFSGSCDEGQFEMPDSLDCGTSPCTQEQCCVNPYEIEVCTSFEQHICSNYEGICKWNETYSPKTNFDSIDCGDEACTVEQCCEHYGARVMLCHAKPVLSCESDVVIEMSIKV